MELVFTWCGGLFFAILHNYSHVHFQWPIKINKTLEALYAEHINGKIKCHLCPHLCLIAEGKTGVCRVRRNVNGTLFAETWGNISALHKDPIEKKPLYHYFPGNSILSIGSVGCNMRCRCCQNWQISQAGTEEYQFERQLTPDEILHIAISDKDNLGVAYTYNEPGMWFEYMMDIARLSNKNGLKNVMVSNGFINESPLEDLMQYIDAFNIDLKGFTETFYRSFTGASLAPVLQTLKQIRNAGRHLEVTCLIVPTRNDDPVEFNKMIDWIEKELGNKTVLHLSRYHPAFKLGIEPTAAADMEALLTIARRKLYHVYAGNIQLKDYQDTKCSNCGKVVIKRTGYNIDIMGLNETGNCRHCGNKEIIC